MGLFDTFTTDNANNAAAAQTNGITTGLNALNSDVGQGSRTLNTTFGEALQPFQVNQATGTKGVNQFANALGLNGAGGNTQAVNAFMNNPGFKFQEQQGDNAINAAEAASGKNFSGNQLIDLSNYNQGLAGTGWQNYMSNLQSFLPYNSTAASGGANVLTGLGSGLNTNWNTVGNAAYGANTSIGNANANADLAGNTASANALGAIGGIGKALLGFLSDERAKDDIEPVGKLFDGQVVYKYRYHGDPRHQIGLIAQEVEDAEPDAVIDGPLKMVNYDIATRAAADLGRFL